MRLIRFRVEFIGHVLASGRSGAETKDHFKRTTDNKLIFMRSWWYSAIASALAGSGLRHIGPDMIVVDPVVDAATAVYERKYGYRESRFHEAIFPGTVVCFRAAVSDGITRSNFTALMERLGGFIGLSPYGCRLGYGKFKLLEVAEENELDKEGLESYGRTSESWRPRSAVRKNA